MKVTAFVASARKRGTYQAACRLMDYLRVNGDIETEVVALSDYNLELCRGCKQCFDRGEEYCPLQDDRDVLVEKICESDGLVLATPNYSFHVAGRMKIFLDRLGYVFHRPQFFDKIFTNIVFQGIYGGRKINRYLDFVGNGLGFRVVRGICLTSVEPVTEKSQQRIDRSIRRLGNRFYSALNKKPYGSPSLFDLMKFRMSRTSIRLMLDESSRDYTHYRDQGWFDAGYFYPVRLSPTKRLVGWMFDRMASRSAGKNGTGDKTTQPSA